MFEKKTQIKTDFLGNTINVNAVSSLPPSLAWMTIGAKVRHVIYGEGKITAIKENYVTVKFNSGKISPFVIKYIESSNALKKA